MDSELRIPSITQDDLYHFQVKHYNPASYVTFDYGKCDASQLNEDATSSFKNPRNEHEETENEEEWINLEDEDGLGYYPDGVKRTLTDEQVAMFRHSEIYSLIRKRQIQKENRDVDENITSEPSNLGSRPNDILTVGQELDFEKSDSNDDEEYFKFAEAERKQMEAEYISSMKRKFSRVDGNKFQNRQPTHRRIARELDDATMSNDVLDYGEETSETPDRLKEHPHDGDNDELRERDAESLTTIRTTYPTVSHEQPQGRTIWWPTIDNR